MYYANVNIAGGNANRLTFYLSQFCIILLYYKQQDGIDGDIRKCNIPPFEEYAWPFLT